jgi:hypothetical protein
MMRCYHIARLGSNGHWQVMIFIETEIFFVVSEYLQYSPNNFAMMKEEVHARLAFSALWMQVSGDSRQSLIPERAEWRYTC